jgi:SAM-dependent methyltransferase
LSPGPGSHGPSSERALLQEEFERTAASFAARTASRFDHMDVVGFAHAMPGVTVAEVGAGTGNFLSRFEPVATRLLAIDLTPAMLMQAARRHPRLELIVADGARLPLPARSIDLVTSAQALHHIHRPVPVVAEMSRVMADAGRVLVVDQVAPERYEEAVAMTELERLRDPSHAVSRPPSALRTVVMAAGLVVLDEAFAENDDHLSSWMPPEEFPADRMERVRRFLEERAQSTGMGWRRDGREWLFVRRRMMILATRP